MCQSKKYYNILVRQGASEFARFFVFNKIFSKYIKTQQVFDGKSNLIYHRCGDIMAYKIAYLHSNQKGICPVDEFTTLAKSKGVDFIVQKFDIRSISNEILSQLRTFDAVIISGSPEIHESLIESLAANLNLYAKCCFKSTNSGNLTAQNLVIVTDTFSSENGGFASTKEFGREAYDTLKFSELEIERTARIAYELAEKMSNRITLSDTHVNLKTANLWRKIVSDINEDYPSCMLDFENIFDTTRKLAEDPSQYSVILADHNNFHALSGVADLKNPLGDGTSTIAYLGETTVGIYGTERANVYAPLFDCIAISKMLEHSFDLPVLYKAWTDSIQNLLQM